MIEDMAVSGIVTRLLNIISIVMPILILLVFANMNKEKNHKGK